MATSYEIDISMDNKTVKALLDGKYSLYGFKAVQSTQGGGKPTVWFKSNNISLTTEVKWQEQYQGYVSTSKIIPNGHIVATNSVDMDLGQKWDVTKTGDGSVEAGDAPQALSLNNVSSRQWACGVNQLVDGKANPLCAFPLYGNSMDVIAPIEKVLLMFASSEVNTGTVIERAYSQGVLVDLTSANLRGVSFDINDGWQWGGYSWARAVAPSTDLVPFLIESPAFIPEPKEFQLQSRVSVA